MASEQRKIERVIHQIGIVDYVSRVFVRVTACTRRQELRLYAGKLVSPLQRFSEEYHQFQLDVSFLAT